MKSYVVRTVFVILLLAVVSHVSAQSLDKTAYDLKGLGPQVTAFESDTVTVLYFTATWCPSCQAFYKDLKANVSLIPSNVRLVFVNYDKSTELKKLYGVTSQHTFVQIDSVGAKKTQWVGSSTVNEFLKKLGSF